MILATPRLASKEKIYQYEKTQDHISFPLQFKDIHIYNSMLKYI